MRRVDVYRRGVRVYVGMVDDPALPYLHWGDSYGFVVRDDVSGPEWELRDAR